MVTSPLPEIVMVSSVVEALGVMVPPALTFAGGPTKSVTLSVRSPSPEMLTVLVALFARAKSESPATMMLTFAGPRRFR